MEMIHIHDWMLIKVILDKGERRYDCYSEFLWGRWIGMEYRNLDWRHDTFFIVFLFQEERGWNGCRTVYRFGIWTLGERFV